MRHDTEASLEVQLQLCREKECPPKLYNYLIRVK